MKTLSETLIERFKLAELDVKDREVEKLIAWLDLLFQDQWNKIEIKTAISELEKAIAQKNKKLVGETIVQDFGDQQMIDPKILELRLQGLKKELKKMESSDAK